MIDKNEQRRRAAEMSQNLAAQGLTKPTLTYPVSKPRPVVAPIPTGARDMEGKSFSVGQTVLRAMLMGRTPYIKKCHVTAIEGGKIYLDGSKQAIRMPERLVIKSPDTQTVLY